MVVICCLILFNIVIFIAQVQVVCVHEIPVNYIIQDYLK